MTNLVALVCILLIPTAATVQESIPDWPQDHILNQLVGNWKATGIAHGHSYTWTMHGEWVLNHQYLRFTEKSTENIFGMSLPFEAVYYLRFDYKQNQYISHLFKSLGSEESSVLGYSMLNGDQLAFVYKLPHESVTEQFTWEPSSQHWHFQSWGYPPNAKRIDILNIELIKSD